MKRFGMGFLLVCLSLAGGRDGLGGNSGTLSVSYEVKAINEIAVSGNPAALVISTAIAGSEPADSVDTSTTYSITTNEASKKVTGVLSVNMPAGVTLKVQLTSPAGASSAGEVALSTTAADLVTGITKKAEGSKAITYRLQTTVASGVVSSSTRTVTFTLTT